MSMCIRVLVCCCWFFSLAANAEISFPSLTGRVVDTANMLNRQAEQQLNALFAGHENATTNQVVVVTLPNLQGVDIETFAYQLGRHWGVGQKDKNNGVLFIIAKQERKIRIEVGYGLEGQLTDAISANIIHSVISPAFKKGNIAGGIQAGSQAIIEALGGKYVMKKRGAKKEKSNKFFMIIFIGIIFWPMLSMMLPSGFRGGRRSHRRGGYYGSGGYGSGGYGSGGFGGGGGFSGGGGSFGGGGASGGW